MNLCIIAIQFEDKYYSIQCQYDGPPRILEMLKSRYPSESSALRFIALGNIELKVGKGFLLTKKDALTHQSSLSLATHAVNSGAANLYVFEEGIWDDIPLVREEISDIVVND